MLLPKIKYGRASSCTQVWRYNIPGGEPVYSSPIDAIVDGVRCIIFQSWDWYIYVVNATTGALIWRYATGAPCYGRCQAADVDGDGHTEIFGASHDGKIYCLNHDGTLRWTFQNLYDREGSGIATGGGANYLDDSGKNWVANSFLRIEGAGFGATLSITSGTGSGQSKEIVAVTATRLTVASNWTTPPDNTSHYVIIPKFASDKFYQHAGTLAQEGIGGNYFLYLAGFDNQVVKLNPVGGSPTIIWRKSTLENIEAFPLVGDVDSDTNNECVTGSIDGHVYCLNGSTGAVKWSRQVDSINGEGVDGALLASDVNGDSIFEILVPVRRGGLTGGGGKVHILKGTDGTDLAQSIDMGGDVDDRPMTVDSTGSNPNIVVGADSGMVLCFDHTGATVWSRNVGQVINSSPLYDDLDNDGQKEIVICDMGGVVNIIDNLTGGLIASVLLNGSIEGIPDMGDLDGSGINKLAVSTIAGSVYMLRFNSATTLNFSFPPVQKPGTDDLEALREDSLSLTGLRQSIWVRTDDFLTLQMDYVPMADLPNWKAFFQYAVQGGQFDYYPDATSSDHAAYELEDVKWNPRFTFRNYAKFSFRMRKVA